VAVIPVRHLDRLRAAGLLISEPFVPGHVAFPDGVVVAKPASLPGHSLPGYEAWWGMSGVRLDAPGLYFHSDGSKWFVTSHDYVPGPGPGDFVNVWNTPEQAVADILDFYFGSPNRMDVKRRAGAVLATPHPVPQQLDHGDEGRRRVSVRLDRPPVSLIYLMQ
jgi:hypothetical protein